MNNSYLSNDEADVINNLMPGNQSFGVGSKIQTALSNGVQFGKKWYLDAVNGSDSNDGFAADTAFKTLQYAYTKLTANKNETLYVIGGASALNITEAGGFTWSKAYTHLVGLSAGGVFGRSRIGHSGVNHVVSLFKVDANGCMFSNIHWQMGNGHAENLNCVLLTAAANYNTFLNCHFDAPLNAAEGAAAYSCLYMTSLTRSNTFKGCWFGDWTASPSSATGCMVRVMGTVAGTQFLDCEFFTNTTSASTVTIIAAVDIAGTIPAGWIMFKRCGFYALATGTGVVATAPTNGKMIFTDCKRFGIAAWSATSTNVITASGTAIDANAGGLGVVQA
jgi:hypothetical protein